MATRKDNKMTFGILEDNKERAKEALQRMKEITIEENYQPSVIDGFSASVENRNYGATFTIPWSHIEWTLAPPIKLAPIKKSKTKVKEDKPEKVIDRFKRMVVVANHKKKKI